MTLAMLRVRGAEEELLEWCAAIFQHLTDS